MTPPPASGDRIARVAAHTAVVLVVAFALIVALELPDALTCPAGFRPVAERTEGPRQAICQPNEPPADGAFRPPVRASVDRHVAPRVTAVVAALAFGWVLLLRPRRRRNLPRRRETPY